MSLSLGSKLKESTKTFYRALIITRKEMTWKMAVETSITVRKRGFEVSHHRAIQPLLLDRRWQFNTCSALDHSARHGMWCGLTDISSLFRPYTLSHVPVFVIDGIESIPLFCRIARKMTPRLHTA
jgi:hypothetical protein